MSKYLTTDTLIESVKRRASIPASQSVFQEEDFLAFANEEMDIGIVPHVLSFHEEYFVYSQDVALEANVSRYEIPTRAVGNKLRDLAYIDDAGNVFEMTRISLEDVPEYQTGAVPYGFQTFYVEGTDIILIPSVGESATGSLRFSYFLRPNALVSEERVAIITSINTLTGEIAVDNIPDNITTDAPLDIIQTKSPHKTRALDVMASGINTNTKIITFDPDDLPRGLSVGDHIASAEETIVPQIPSDLHSMLAQRVAARCLESLGDNQGLSAANAKLGEMEQKTGAIIADRVEGAPLKVVSKHSTLKRNSRWRF